MEPWIGVDLDGTLAEYTTWKGPEHIGKPVPKMVERIKAWLAMGKTVKVFTARVCDGQQSTKQAIQDWCVIHIGQALEVTNVKDYGMVEFWDDLAIQVIQNTGLRADGKD